MVESINKKNGNGINNSKINYIPSDCLRERVKTIGAITYFLYNFAVYLETIFYQQNLSMVYYGSSKEDFNEKVLQ